MINIVRNTVLSILNKNNYGYLSPSDFNLFAKNAQLAIFEDYFYQINYQTNKENARMSRSGLSDIGQQLKEIVEYFTIAPIVLTRDANNVYFAPSVITTGFDYYSILNVYCYDTSVTPKRYLGEAEKMDISRVELLKNSMLTKPSKAFPSYALNENKITILPETINTVNAVECQYIRYPKDPKWTFVSLAGGSPSFDQSAADYQDFELPTEAQDDLIVKICQMAGISIRESEVYQYAKSEEQFTNQDQK